MESVDELSQDVMQVCRNGHVITDLLRTYPERGLSHCHRCGSATVDRCSTCGMALPGAIRVPGLEPIGGRRPPLHCATCGAPYPWARKPAHAPAADAFVTLEKLLRRLPRAVRALRSRYSDRPPFRVADEYDLEDLLRAVLPLHFEDIRLESRTPSYAAGTRTDFLLAAEKIAVTVKRATPAVRERQLVQRLEEDFAYYRQQSGCPMLVVLVFDPEGLLPNRGQAEAAWSRSEDGLTLRCVIAL